MSSNLNVPQLAQGQARPDVTANNATAALDAAVTETFTCDGTAANVTVTAAQYQNAIRFFVTGLSASARNITLPAVKRLVYVDVDSANTHIGTLVVGSTSIVLVNGNKYLVWTDGTTNGLTATSLGSDSTLPFDMGLFVPGTLIDAQLVLRFNVDRPFTLPVSLTGSIFSAGTASTGTVHFTVKQNGSSIGTITFTASATGTPTFAAAVTFAVSDVITITGPATHDATLADVGLNFKGTR